ncbi:MAG TPA: type II secretion system F family protein [Longimicrobium sp.]|jgi:tight adherence protein C
MVVYAIAALIGLSVVLMVLGLAELAAARPRRAVVRQLAQLERSGAAVVGGPARREAQLQRFGEWLHRIGERGRGADTGSAKQLLVEAGFRGPGAAAVFRGVRIALPLALGGAASLILPIFGVPTAGAMFAALWMAAAGWIAPGFFVGRRARSRQRELQRALPDALDLLVVCVEAGLGLNQAMMRVSQEIRHVSVLISDELGLVNLEIRAGVPRQDALRNLGTRTGVQELRSLGAMLIQTDRFGTSIAQAMRIHADTLRTKRRQRAEEAAAKTTVKLVFPLVLFVFPAMFVVLLGPALLQIVRVLGDQ